MIIAYEAAAMRYIRSTLIYHAVDIPNEVMNTRTGCVACTKEEHVKEKDGVVVEKVAESGFG